MRPTCPKCDHQLVSPLGDQKADVLLMGEFAGWKEMEKGIPFVADAGEALRYEIQRAGAFDYYDCRITNLYPHDKTSSCDRKWLWKQAFKEIRKHRFALLMGSEFGGLVVPGGVMENSGRVLRFPGGTIGVLTVNPAAMEKDGPGEFRFALGRFIKIIGGKRATWKGSIAVPPPGDRHSSKRGGSKEGGGRGSGAGRGGVRKRKS